VLKRGRWLARARFYVPSCRKNLKRHLGKEDVIMQCLAFVLYQCFSVEQGVTYCCGRKKSAQGGRGLCGRSEVKKV
jgi:hypothetical protein